MKDVISDSIMDSIMIAEGGFWNDPIGGPTNFGITQKTLNAVRKKFPTAPLPVSVKGLDEHTARLILRKEYLEATNVLKLPYPLSIFHSHMVVMSWDDGIRIMQKRLGVAIDGVLGSKTLAAVNNEGALEQLYGLATDLKVFLSTRSNGYIESYRNRFNRILL